MVTQQAAIELVRRFAQEVRERVRLREVILFGSFARNEQHPWSDIDVALVSDDFTDAIFLDIRPFAAIVGRYADIEPHTFSPQRFANAVGDPFIETIKQTGIVVA
jgi:uncharacterized protein